MGCSSSKNVQAYSTRPQPYLCPSPSSDNAHLVALTSSTYGIFSLDNQKKTDEVVKDVEDPVNQMYKRMMNLDGPGSQFPQSWSEVSNVLSQLKTEAQQKSSHPVRVEESETVDISELLANFDDGNKRTSQEVPMNKPAQKPENALKRDISVIHTLEEVDKLAHSSSPDDSHRYTDNDDEDTVDSEMVALYDSPHRRRQSRNFGKLSGSKRVSMSSIRSRNTYEKPYTKPSQSLSCRHNQENQPNSSLFDAEFLESFKEAFQQLSTNVPSTDQQRKKLESTKSTPVKTKPTVVRPLEPTKSTPVKPETNVVRRLEPTKSTPVKSESTVVKSLESGNGQQKRSVKVNLANSRLSTTKSTPVKHQDEEFIEDNWSTGPKFKEHETVKQKPSPVKEKHENEQDVYNNETNSVRSKVVNWQRTLESNMVKPARSIDIKRESKSAPTKTTTVKPDPLARFPKKCPPDGENKVVLYSTSLRGIRKTFDDCHIVRNILHSFDVEIDERDVSMDSEFRQQLKYLMEQPVPVPRLFIKGRYIGGVEEVVRVHEEGILGKALEGIPRGRFVRDCDGCGGARFIPCTDCNGSCKAIGGRGEVVKCPECNENGLVRCPICS